VVNKKNNQKNKSVTSFDVAKKAGVSPSTVSLVINGKATGRVTLETKERILQACADLGYKPNTAAQSLRLGNSKTIAMVIPDISNSYFASVFRGAKHVAIENSYEVTLLETMNNPNWDRWVSSSISASSIGGLIFYAADSFDQQILDKIYPNVVLVESIHDGIASITLDVREATIKAIQYLINLGHERIAYLKADYVKETFHTRFQAYEDILTKNSIPIYDDYILSSHFDIIESLEAANLLLSKSPRPTAIFCDDDILAAGVYKAAKRSGIRIPEDISVIGFNDVQLAQMLEPELTSVNIPAFSVGAISMELLIEVLTGHTPSTRNISLKLIKRGSVRKISNR